MHDVFFEQKKIYAWCGCPWFPAQINVRTFLLVVLCPVATAHQDNKVE